MAKKCPVCNSTRYENVEGNFRCARCGYVNKSIENLKRDVLDTNGRAERREEN